MEQCNLTERKACPSIPWQLPLLPTLGLNVSGWDPESPAAPEWKYWEIERALSLWWVHHGEDGVESGGTSNTHESWTEAALARRARVARHCSAGCRQQLTVSAVLAFAGWTKITAPEPQDAGGYYPQWPKLFPPPQGYTATHVHIYPSIYGKGAGEGDRGNKSLN